MRVTETDLPGVLRLDLTRHEDERGFFARVYCERELAQLGIAFTSKQINLSRNPACLTLRGMHFQEPPYAEAKIVRVVRGQAFDVAVALRVDSPTFGRWTASKLSADRGNALIIPEGCAHGFLTLEENTDILYQMGSAYVPGMAKGLLYSDSELAIDWPAEPKMIAEADLLWPSFASYVGNLYRGSS